jgi:hypothetical protein
MANHCSSCLSKEKKECNMNHPAIKNIFIAVFMFFSWGIHASAQSASASLERERIFVGEQIRLNLKFTFPIATENFQIPLFDNDTITKSIEIISRERTDTFSADRKLREIDHSYIITSFDSGTHVIPAFTYSFIPPDQTDPVVLMTDSLLLSVNLVPVDTTQTIMDIKNPWGIPFQWREYLHFFIIGFVVLLIIIALIYYSMRRRKGLPLFPSRITPPLPADEEALLALDKIKKEKIWKNGLVKDYYTLITDAIRRYIERRYDIPAPEFTSAETLEAIAEIDIDSEASAQVEHVLNVADMVKFAKANPDPTEHENCLSRAYDFILKTRPEIKDETTNSKENLNQETTTEE